MHVCEFFLSKSWSGFMRSEVPVYPVWHLCDCQYTDMLLRILRPEYMHNLAARPQNVPWVNNLILVEMSHRPFLTTAGLSGMFSKSHISEIHLGDHVLIFRFLFYFLYFWNWVLGCPNWPSTSVPSGLCEDHSTGQTLFSFWVIFSAT